MKSCPSGSFPTREKFPHGWCTLPFVGCAVLSRKRPAPAEGPTRWGGGAGSLRAPGPSVPGRLLSQEARGRSRSRALPSPKLRTFSEGTAAHVPPARQERPGARGCPSSSHPPRGARSHPAHRPPLMAGVGLLLVLWVLRVSGFAEGLFRRRSRPGLHWARAGHPGFRSPSTGRCRGRRGSGFRVCDGLPL